LMMYSVTHNPYSLMFVCMSPMMMGGVWVDGKGGERPPPMRGRRGLLEVDIIRWVLPVWVRAKARGQKAHNQQEQ